MPNKPLDLIPAYAAHAYQLAPRLKQADRDEVMAASGFTPLEALLTSLEISEKAYALVTKAQGEVIALGGLVPLSKEVGIPWALTSEDIACYPKEFCTITKELIREFHTSYKTLTNFCDAKNTTTIRWLKHCGFRFAAEIPEFGVTKKPFVQFVSKAKFERCCEI